MWSDDSTLSYTNWYSGEPNNSGSGEDCAVSQSNIGYGWNDGVCSLTTIEGYVCVSR